MCLDAALFCRCHARLRKWPGGTWRRVSTDLSNPPLSRVSSAPLLPALVAMRGPLRAEASSLASAERPAARHVVVVVVVVADVKPARSFGGALSSADLVRARLVRGGRWPRGGTRSRQQLPLLSPLLSSSSSSSSGTPPLESYGVR